MVTIFMTHDYSYAPGRDQAWQDFFERSARGAVGAARELLSPSIGDPMVVESGRCLRLRPTFNLLYPVVVLVWEQRLVESYRSVGVRCYCQEHEE